MNRLLAVSIFLLVAASCRESPTGAASDPKVLPAPPLAAAQPETFTLVIPIQFDTWACVEMVTLEGELLGVYHTNYTPHGNHGRQLFLQRLTGYGQLSGYKYEAVGNSQAAGMVSGAAADPYSEVFTFMLVSRAAQLHVRLLLHTTVNANGDLTADLLDSSVTCQAR